MQAAADAARGAWLACLVGAVILGGLFFRETLAAKGPSAKEAVHGKACRRSLFTSCFFVGPFAEASTGFGVGQVTVAPGLAGLGVAPLDAVCLGLFSQALVPWGALGTAQSSARNSPG